MPLFEYECPKCSTITEFLGRPESLPLCTECGMILERVISKPNFILKGNTWAKDNYERTTI